MVKSKKKKKASKKTAAKKKISVRKNKTARKKSYHSKNKKAKQKHHKKEFVKKRKRQSVQNVLKIEADKKEKSVLFPSEITATQSPAWPSQPAIKLPSPKTIAKAKAAFAAKEKAKIPPLPVDKVAAEKQLKLPEPKNKLELEYIIHASPALLYEFISTPSGLSEWFADNVNIQGSIYSFIWEGAEQKARLLSARENKSVRFQWIDRSAASYFELRIEKNELTDELSLFITDFADSPDEIGYLERLWNEQVHQLMKVIGSKI